MKRFLLILFIFSSSTVAFSVGESGIIHLSGIVEEHITMALPVVSFQVQLEDDGKTEWQICDLVFNCNFNSWKVSIASKHGGQLGGYLVNTDNPEEKVEYLISIIGLTPDRQTLPWQSLALAKTPRAGLSYPLVVHLTPAGKEYRQTGIYADYLIITLSQGE
jgi:hypothetical protein